MCRITAATKRSHNSGVQEERGDPPLRALCFFCVRAVRACPPSRSSAVFGVQKIQARQIGHLIGAATKGRKGGQPSEPGSGSSRGFSIWRYTGRSIPWEAPVFASNRTCANADDVVVLASARTHTAHRSRTRARRPPRRFAARSICAPPRRCPCRRGAMLTLLERPSVPADIDPAAQRGHPPRRRRMFRRRRMDVAQNTAWAGAGLRRKQSKRRCDHRRGKSAKHGAPHFAGVMGRPMRCTVSSSTYDGQTCGGSVSRCPSAALLRIWRRASSIAPVCPTTTWLHLTHERVDIGAVVRLHPRLQHLPCDAIAGQGRMCILSAASSPAIVAASSMPELRST